MLPLLSTTVLLTEWLLLLPKRLSRRATIRRYRPLMLSVLHRRSPPDRLQRRHPPLPWTPIVVSQALCSTIFGPTLRPPFPPSGSPSSLAHIRRFCHPHSSGSLLHHPLRRPHSGFSRRRLDPRRRQGGTRGPHQQSECVALQLETALRTNTEVNNAATLAATLSLALPSPWPFPSRSDILLHAVVLPWLSLPRSISS